MKWFNWIFLTIVALILPSAASAEEWPGSFLARVEATALIETLNAELLSNPSATLTLERWCGAHRLATEAKVSAHLVRGEDRQITPEDRQRFAIMAEEPVRYRRVQLFCGDKLLSEADNWYVPSRLTPEMNRLLDETDTPFGRAVKDLEFQRQTLKVTALCRSLTMCWSTVPFFLQKRGCRSRSWSRPIPDICSIFRSTPRSDGLAPGTICVRSR